MATKGRKNKGFLRCTVTDSKNMWRDNWELEP